MKRFLFTSSKNKVKELFRSLFYSSIIGLIFFILSYAKQNDLESTFTLFSVSGFIIILLESFFTLNHTESFVSQSKYKDNKHFLSHALNHLFYPVIFYLGLVYFINFTDNLILIISLSLASFIVYFIHFTLLRYHIIYDHVDAHTHKHSVYKLDVIFGIFKLLSFFILSLSLFLAYDQGRIETGIIYVITLAISFIYLIFHLSRKNELGLMNVFLAALFSIIISLFILEARSSNINVSAALSTVIFYTGSAIFYHKVDGTLNLRILIEYSSIIIMLSILIFSF